MRWERLASEVMFRTGVFCLRRDTSRSVATSLEHDFYILETRDWVNVLPVTADQQVVMVRQYRHGIQELTLEVPAGMMDPHDVSPLEAARRELREETGYACPALTPLGTIHPNPAIMNNRCHMFAAPGVQLVGAPEPDATEELEVTLVPLAEVPQLIRAGAISNALTVVAFQLFGLHV